MSIKKIKKILVLGDNNVGKTLLISQLCKEKNEEEGFLKIRNPTVGASFKSLFVNDTEFQIWEIANDVRTQNLLNLYLKGTDIAILVVDSTTLNIESLNKRILQVIEDGGVENIIIVFNKIDETMLTENERKQMTAQCIPPNAKIIYIETSAKTNVGIKKLSNQIYLCCSRNINLEYFNYFNYTLPTRRKKCCVF